MKIHEMLDTDYSDERLQALLAEGVDLTERHGPLSETPLHVATRRRRTEAVQTLLDHGAEIDARDGAGKTAWAHAIRRRFTETADLLAGRGAATDLNDADRFAVAVVDGDLDEARRILAEHPGVIRTGNTEEDRLLADIAGRPDPEPVRFLIESGADLTAPGLDNGTPLHQAAWFGQPQNAKLLIEAGAPLDIYEKVHGYSPIGWVAHGSLASGGARARQKVYVELARLLLEAGCTLGHPKDPGGTLYLESMLSEASEPVCQVLKEYASRTD